MIELDAGSSEERQKPHEVCVLCGGYAERGVGAEMGVGVAGGRWQTVDAGSTAGALAVLVRRYRWRGIRRLCGGARGAGRWV
jgi:hypothetical protein